MTITVKQLKQALDHFDFDDDTEVIIGFEEWFTTDAGTSLSDDRTETCLAIGELTSKRRKNTERKLILGTTEYLPTENKSQKVNPF